LVPHSSQGTQPGADVLARGRLRAADDSPDFRVGQVVHIAVKDRRPLLGRQLSHRLPERRLSVQCRIDGLLRHVLDRDRPPPPPAMRVDRLAVRDREDPGAQVRRVPQAWIRPQGRNKRLLEAIVCIVPADDTPPEAPSTPSITSSDGAITLIWAPNAEPDIAGYLVLRGEAGDATLTPVSDTVVTETRLTDRTVKPGVRYIYAVQAIDSRLPRPNVSPESERVEETAR